MAALEHPSASSACCAEELSDAAEDYLKALYHLTAGDASGTVSGLAQRLGVSAPSASSMVKRLVRAGLVARDAQQGILLTDHGRWHALQIVRRHRLLETYLARSLGLPWDEVHAEAEVLEHALSERLADRIATALGHPEVDPHGDPIPPKVGRHDEGWREPLGAAPAGRAFTVERVSDRDSEALRHLADLGIRPGATLTVRARDPFDGPLWVEVGERVEALGAGLTEIVYGVVHPPGEDGEPADVDTARPHHARPDPTTSADRDR